MATRRVGSRRTSNDGTPDTTSILGMIRDNVATKGGVKTTFSETSTA